MLGKGVKSDKALELACEEIAGYSALLGNCGACIARKQCTAGTFVSSPQCKKCLVNYFTMQSYQK